MRRATLAALAVASAAFAGGLTAESVSMTLEGVKGVYSQPGVTVEPPVQGSLKLRLTSPRNELHLDDNVLRLEPVGDGTHRVGLTVTFRGHGWLVAELDAAGTATPFEDEVRIPEQTLEIAARVRLERGEGGYDVTPVEIPATAEVRFESNAAQGLLSLCRGMAALPIFPVDCRVVERSLTRADLPLPAVGETFHLQDGFLTAADRRQIDAYLTAHDG
ncbi:MAG: hypothetical protein AAF604_20030 [Acidobacteriota bacterium]